MFIVAPLSTDAAIDHKPWATGAIILANVAVAVLLGFPDFTVQDTFWGPAPEPPFVNSMVLQWGSFNPLQWLTHAFVQGGYIHLVFNMMFLWCFGLVVEGAIGWQRFLMVYGILAAVPGVAGQIVMLGSDAGGAIGASAAISGLMAIAALWAPRNHVRVFVWFVSIIRKLEVKVLGFCGLWLGLDVLFAMLGGFRMSSSLVHVAGAAVGVAVGVVMLRRKWVDCEGWDYLSLRASGGPRPIRVPVSFTESIDEVDEEDMLVCYRNALKDGDGFAADALASRLSLTRDDWEPTRDEELNIIRLLHRTPQHERCAARMEKFLARHPKGAESVRIMLAELLLKEGRPTSALEQLDRLPHDGALTEAQRRARDGIARDATDASADRGLELE